MTDTMDQLRSSAIVDFCRRHRVARLSLFGSVLHRTARPESDLDLLIEFLPGARVSLFDLGAMSLELDQLLGTAVDLRTPGDLSAYFRDAVLAEAKVIYAA